MVGVWIALQDENEEKTDVSNVIHRLAQISFNYFSSNINTPNLRNNLVNFVFVVYGEREPNRADLIRKEKMD
jgi:hypothetical protein